MATEVILPKLGQTMEEGTIVEWFKQEGDEVKRGEILFTVESDKATLESESPGRGILRKILVSGGRDGAGVDRGRRDHADGGRGHFGDLERPARLRSPR